MLDVNVPVAAITPLSVLSSCMDGTPVVFQQTPYAVGLELPRAVISPFPVAVVVPMAVTAWVVTVAAVGKVAKETSIPYDVPAPKPAIDSILVAK